VGRRWTETVTRESLPKINALIANALTGAGSSWLQVNHFAAAGPDVPVLYATMRAGPSGRIVAFGRDLRGLSSLQRRLVDAQQSMERDYARIRHVETRYRLLFEMATDAVLIVNLSDQTIADTNPAARHLLSDQSRRSSSGRLSVLFTPDSAHGVELLLAGVTASGRQDDVRATLVEGEQSVIVSAMLFRDDSGPSCLVRIVPEQPSTAVASVPKIKSKLLKLVDSAPDAFVVTDHDGRIITTNAAFLRLTQLPTEHAAIGESLERWLGRAGVDLDILTAGLRQHGSIKLFDTTLRGELAESCDVEISAVTVMNGGRPCFGFTIRDVSLRLSAETRRAGKLPTSLEHLTGLIGRVALKDLVREATDLIERLCIEAALELTGDNRASAAEILGLSRQSLYVKLRRYGMGDLAPEGAD